MKNILLEEWLSLTLLTKVIWMQHHRLESINPLDHILIRIVLIEKFGILFLTYFI